MPSWPPQEPRCAFMAIHWHRGHWPGAFKRTRCCQKCAYKQPMGESSKQVSTLGRYTTKITSALEPTVSPQPSIVSNARNSISILVYPHRMAVITPRATANIHTDGTTPVALDNNNLSVSASMSTGDPQKRTGTGSSGLLGTQIILILLCMYLCLYWLPRKLMRAWRLWRATRLLRSRMHTSPGCIDIDVEYIGELQSDIKNHTAAVYNPVLGLGNHTNELRFRQ